MGYKEGASGRAGSELKAAAPHSPSPSTLRSPEEAGRASSSCRRRGQWAGAAGPGAGSRRAPPPAPGAGRCGGLPGAGVPRPAIRGNAVARWLQGTGAAAAEGLPLRGERRASARRGAASAGAGSAPSAREEGTGQEGKGVRTLPPAEEEDERGAAGCGAGCR